MQTQADWRAGTGNWAYFNIPLEDVFEAAREWKNILAGVGKPWLCWSVSPAWCLIQQKLVKRVGWVPVVGFDPKYEPPQLVPGAIQIDFNSKLKLPQMWSHFPLEFAWLYAPKLAFWHADLLCRFSMMEDAAKLFEKLTDGEMAAVWDYGGFRRLLNRKMHRYWEVLGCMTHGASKDNFEKGCGWWRHIDCHPSVATEAARQERRKLFYDHGQGIMYWKRHYGGRVREISLRRAVEGHCSEIGNKNYRVLPGHTEHSRNVGKEMELNYDIEQVCRRLGIQSLL